MNIKTDFSIFSSTLKGKAYLDNAATTQKPKSVIDALVSFYERYNSNVHRGLYDSAEHASKMYESARTKIAEYINADPSEVVFTSGATEGINFIAHSLKSDDIVLTSPVEHHSNLLPWQRFNVRYLEFDKGTYTLGTKVEEGVKLVAVTMHSNVLGPVWSVDGLKELISNAHKVGARVLLDAAQVVPRSQIDVKELGADFVVFSGHKMMGPTGIGVLYIKKDIDIEPYKLGGSMVYSAGYQESSWELAPHKYEAGTPPIAQAIGLGRAVEYLMSLDLKSYRDHELRLCSKLVDSLGSRVLGNISRIKQEGHLVSFTTKAHAHDIAAYLNGKGVLVRAGHHCTQPLHNLLGINSSIRVSFYFYNTQEDVDKLLCALKEAEDYYESLSRRTDRTFQKSA